MVVRKDEGHTPKARADRRLGPRCGHNPEENGAGSIRKKSGETECTVKTIQKSQNDGEFSRQKGPFLTNFERCQKSDKNWSILRLNCSKKTPFFATTKSGTKSTSRTG